MLTDFLFLIFVYGGQVLIVLVFGLFSGLYHHRLIDLRLFLDFASIRTITLTSVLKWYSIWKFRFNSDLLRLT